MLTEVVRRNPTFHHNSYVKSDLEAMYLDNLFKEYQSGVTSGYTFLVDARSDRFL